MTEDSIGVIALTAFLTYSLPKIIELLMKRFGEPKMNLDTANIKNALALYDTLKERHAELEGKYTTMETRYEKALEEGDELEKKYIDLERKYWLLERTAERLKEENDSFKERYLNDK